MLPIMHGLPNSLSVREPIYEGTYGRFLYLYGYKKQPLGYLFTYTLISLFPDTLKNISRDIILVTVKMVEYAAALPKLLRITSA